MLFSFIFQGHLAHNVLNFHYYCAKMSLPFRLQVFSPLFSPFYYAKCPFRSFLLTKSDEMMHIPFCLNKIKRK